MIVWATSLMAFARAMSMGLSGSLRASIVSKRWLRRSLILFFIGSPDPALQRGAKPDDLGEVRRQTVDGVPPHQFAARDQFEVREFDVTPVAISECDRMSLRDRSIGLPPHQNVNPDPVPRRIAGVGDLTLEVSLFGEARRTYGLPRVWLRTLLELCLGHSA